MNQRESVCVYKSTEKVEAIKEEEREKVLRKNRKRNETRE
jgi:hypothetical protein